MLYSPTRIATFWSRVDRRGPNECWNWTGSLNHAGYGRFAPRIDGKLVRIFAYRYAFEATVGMPVPEGMQVDHLCRNRACCNPAHLEVVTPRENNRRSDCVSGKNGRKTRCDHGHSLEGENLYLSPDGRRQCRTCRREACERYEARKRAA